MRKTTFREIRHSLGRYLAIMAIMALGVGFFAGLKITKTAMVNMADEYWRDKQLFDYRLLSTIGFEQEDVEAFARQGDVRAAEGAVSTDILGIDESGHESVFKVHSLPEQINKIELAEGRMPQKGNECVVDSRQYTSDSIGKKIVISPNNEQEDSDMFVYAQYTIVGIASSSYYANFERGNTALGSGRVSGFMYIPMDGFDCDYYTEVFIKLNQDYAIYSDAYDGYMDEKEDAWDDICGQQVQYRYQSVVKDAQKELDDARKELEDQEADAQEEMLIIEAMLASFGEEYTDSFEDDYDFKEESDRQMASAEEEMNRQLAKAKEEIADAQKELDDFKEPDYYVLGRNTNMGYACFDNDSGIIDGIANVVPLFFFLVAALVCMTTMNRMVEEERTQIGVLKALGYGEGVIMSKYLFYSGSAAIAGCVIGFFGGTYLFPAVIWQAYSIMYDLAQVKYIFDGGLACISVLVALLCSMGATWFTCKSELCETAANLMRPKSPKAGKRVLLERVAFLWRRLKFLHKVSIRNIFRYKKRFFMMVTGISGCTALLVTGYGIRDSVSDVAVQQFEEIQIYDMSISFKEAQNQETADEFTNLAADLTESYAYFYEEAADLEYDGNIKTINLVVPQETSVEQFLDFHTTSGQPLSFPKEGGAFISHKISSDYGISVGDTIILRDSEMREMELSVSGIFENYVYNYVYIGADTYAACIKDVPAYKTAYVNLKQEQGVHEASAAFMKLDGVSSVTVNSDTKERFENMMESLDYVVLLVIFCAAFLAFIVLYNLTNINITERVREIATLKVLGFYRSETASYVLRENLILTVIGTAAGLVLGYFLHAFVMAQINIDMIAFDVRVKSVSYLYSILLTMLFTCVVNLFMSAKLETINMAESLKAVD